MKNFFYNNKTNILFLFISLICTISVLGLENLSFKSIKWLHDGNESAIEQTAWYFFRNDIWRFPLGLNPNYGNEISTSIVFSDSIPLFALIFKVFKSFLPNNFQYFSLWYFLSFYLQLFFSYKILMKFTNSQIYSIIGSLFFIFAPIFIFRLNWHASVSAQWLLLFTLYLGLTKKIDESKSLWFFLITLSSLILYNFTIIVVAVYSGLRILNIKFKKEKFYELFKDFFLISIFLTLLLYAVGYFEIRALDTLAVGFGHYKLNLLSFFDPVNTANNLSWSWFLPDIKLSKAEELEGFNYLGIGYILMYLFSLIIFFKKSNKENLISIKKNKNFKFLLLISLFLTFWALSNKISFGSHTLLEIPLNKYFFGILSISKATGRLFWIVNYLILALSLIIIFKSFKKKTSLFLITLFLTIQVADISSVFKDKIFYLKPFIENTNLEDQIWGDIFKENKIIKTTYPTSWPGLFHKFSLSMEVNRLQSTNLAPQSRVNRKALADSRYKLNDQFNNKKISDNTIYVIDNYNHLINLKKLLSKENVGFFYRDNVWFMIADKKKLMNSNDIFNFERVKPKILSINEGVDLNYNNEESYYGLGWSHNSGQPGVWSEGNKSSILFNTEKNFKKIKLEIICSPYITKKTEFVEFDVLVNNNLNKKFKLSKKDKKIEILINEEIVKDNEIKIDFNFKNLISPYEVFQSPDSRKLGILVKNIKISSI